MSFLAPLFLLGGLAVVAPIVFHLIRQTTRERRPFSSLMFLSPTPSRVTRRNRLENLWLLLLRCLIVALLALGFARPFLPNAKLPLNPASAKRTVILLDTSASMRREDLWKQARAKAEEILRQASPEDQAAVLAFDDRVRSLIDFAEWKRLPVNARAAATIRRFDDLSPGWGATRLDAALITAGELFLETGSEKSAGGEIVVISDLQEGAKLDGLQKYEWPRGVHVTLDPVAAHQVENASLQWLADTEEADKPGNELPLRVRVSNVAESKREQFELRWSAADGVTPTDAKVEAYVPAGQTRIVKPPPPPPGSTLLVLSGDSVTFDNSLFIIPPQPLQTPLLFVGKDAPDDSKGSLYYLRRAFPKTRRQNVEFVTHDGADPISPAQLQQAQLAFVGEGASDAALDSVREFAQSGRIVVLPLTSAESASALARILNAPGLTAAEATVKDYALLGQIDFQHPFFAPFADPRFSDFTKIHFWKYRRLDASAFPGAHVPAGFDAGDPAVVQVPLGKGSVVILASSWRPVDSQLALSSKFVPLLQTMLEQSSSLPPQKAQYFVGDEMVLSTAPEPVTVHKPNGETVTVAAGEKFTGADQPGIYTVDPGGRRIVVNLTPDESRTSPLAPERLAALGVPLNLTTPESAAAAAAQRAQAQGAELESRQKIWRWLVAAALASLLLETLLASKISRHPVNLQQSST